MLEEMPTNLFPVLTTTGQNDFSIALLEKLKSESHKISDKREQLAETADRLFGIEKSFAEKNGKEVAPSISTQTMELLLSIYGDNSRLSVVARAEARPAVEMALKADPYFIWLTEKMKSSLETTFSVESSGTVHMITTKDPTAHLFASLSGTSALPLSVAIWRLRSEMDPSLHMLTRSAVESLLVMNRQELIVMSLLQQLQTLIGPGNQSYIWNYARNLEHAQRSRDELLAQVRERAGKHLSPRQYELLNEMVPYEVVLLRQFFEANEGRRLENLLLALNTIIEVAQKVDDANIYR